MRYPEGHREKTRSRILETAGKLFKKSGYSATGVDAVMSAAGLTAGGFYNHFGSKDDLFAGTLDRALDDQVKRWTADPEGADPARVLGFIERYLSEQHRNGTVEGCALPSLAPEVARAGTVVRRVLEKHLRSFLPYLESSLSGPDRAARALAILALSVGGIVLARGVASRAFSSSILAACRDAARRLATLEETTA